MNELSISSTSGASTIEKSSYSIPRGYLESSKASVNLTLIQSLDSDLDDASTIDFGDSALASGISLTAEEILAKINELLKADLPEGIESLAPSEVTPEATAERIVNGSTAFFSIYAQQNPDLEGEDLLNSFLDTIRGGIDQGYNEAVSILDGLGAFSIEGVKSGVEETRRLIDVKLAEFEARKREELGLPSVKIGARAAESTQEAVLSQAGSSLNVIA